MTALVQLLWHNVAGEYVTGAGDYAYNVSKLPAGSATAYKWITTARQITGSPNEPVVLRRNLTLAEAKQAAAFHATKEREERVIDG